MSSSDGFLRSKPPTGRRNLIVVRVGDGSLHRNWLSGSGRRDFDLLLSYYGSVDDQFRDDGEHYHVGAGTQWPVHAAILRDNADVLKRYDHVCFACDDLDAGMATWNALFSFCEAHDLDLAQPSIVGPVSFPVTAPVENVLYRLTGFVEIMCPVFSRRALAVCSPTFSESVSGWGLDEIWPAWLLPRGHRMGIIDAVRVTHTRGLREGSFYRLLADRGIDPWKERLDVMERFNVKRAERSETARVPRSASRIVLSWVKQTRALRLLRRWRRT